MLALIALSPPPPPFSPQFKELVLQKLGAQGKFLRLILNGKLLSPDSATLSSFKVNDRCCVHCVVSEQAPAAPTGPHVGESNVSSPYTRP